MGSGWWGLVLGFGREGWGVGLVGEWLGVGGLVLGFGESAGGMVGWGCDWGEKGGVWVWWWGSGWK